MGKVKQEKLPSWNRRGGAKRRGGSQVEFFPDYSYHPSRAPLRDPAALLSIRALQFNYSLSSRALSCRQTNRAAMKSRSTAQNVKTSLKDSDISSSDGIYICLLYTSPSPRDS